MSQKALPRPNAMLKNCIHALPSTSWQFRIKINIYLEYNCAKACYWNLSLNQDGFDVFRAQSKNQIFLQNVQWAILRILMPSPDL